MVLGGLSGCQPDARHVCHTVPAPGRAFPLRNRLSDPPQAPRWYGSISASAARPATMEVDKPGSAAVTRGKGRGVHHKLLAPAPLKCDSASREPSFDTEGRSLAGRVRLAVVPDRSAESLPCEGAVTGCVDHRRLVRLYQPRQARLRTPRSPERGNPRSEEYLPIIHLVLPT